MRSTTIFTSTAKRSLDWVLRIGPCCFRLGNDLWACFREATGGIRSKMGFWSLWILRLESLPECIQRKTNFDHLSSDSDPSSKCPITQMRSHLSTSNGLRWEETATPSHCPRQTTSLPVLSTSTPTWSSLKSRCTKSLSNWSKSSTSMRMKESGRFDIWSLTLWMRCASRKLISKSSMTRNGKRWIRRWTRRRWLWPNELRKSLSSWVSRIHKR